MAQGTYKCSQCSRTFSMAGHLGRHMSAIHGVSKPKPAPKAKAKRKGKALGRPKGSGKGKKKGASQGGLGRPSGLSTRLGLRSMSLDQLSELITEARAEARRKLAAMKDVFA